MSEQLDTGAELEIEPHSPEDEDPFPEHQEDPSAPDWFKTAVFYEVLVRSFRDSNGDGTGDFRGLIEKLDYLEWLGVDCLWITPFLRSPQRDTATTSATTTPSTPATGPWPIATC